MSERQDELDKLVRGLRRLFADIDDVEPEAEAEPEPEPDWRKHFPPPWDMGGPVNEAWILAADGTEVKLDQPSCPGYPATEVKEHIVQCVNDAEAKRGKGCCINCGAAPDAGHTGHFLPDYRSADRVGPLCSACWNYTLALPGGKDVV